MNSIRKYDKRVGAQDFEPLQRIMCKILYSLFGACPVKYYTFVFLQYNHKKGKS